MSSDPDDDRTLTELEYVEMAVRRAAVRVTGHRRAAALLILADELWIADISQLDGGSVTRLGELERLRRRQT